jgi:VanZ family protein
VALHKTSAWPLAQAYAALIVYASLYPFTGWRDQGVAPLAYLASPWPRYWTGFDVAANLVGYAPLGFLLALSVLRRGGNSAMPSNRAAIAVATLAAALLSLCMEALQSYLPSRVPSNVDFALNALGAFAGGVTAGGLELAGAIDRWSSFRLRWFVDEARGALVLLALWPFALLFPAAVPLGLGQVFERLENALADWLLDTPFLMPGTEMLCVALGVLIPCLLGFSIIRSSGRRAMFAFVAISVGVLVTALSAALSWGPSHAWAWLSRPVSIGLGVGLVLAMASLVLPRRGCAAVLLLVLVVHLSMLNQAPASAYFAQTLQTWEQGRFIHFNGLGQWLGWLWPYAALVYVLIRLSSREREA